MDQEPDPFFYRATVKRYAIAERRIARHADGLDEYAHVRVSLLPSPRGSGNVLSWHAGSHIPDRFAAFVVAGVATAIHKGILGGIEFVDVSATIETGSYHESDSNGPAFREAAETATAEALRRAEPVLLEAIVAITTSLPEEFTGVVHGFADSHEAVIQNIASQERIVSLTSNLAASKISTLHVRSV
jgi:elongation factor G